MESKIGTDREGIPQKHCVLDKGVKQSVTVANAKGFVAEGLRGKDMEHRRDMDPTGTDTQQAQRPDKDREDAKPPPREHNLEQELVDYEVEEGDMIPPVNRGNVKPHAATGDKPQPPKISWNEWAGADANEFAKRCETRDPERKREGGMTDVQRVPIRDSRKGREDMREGRGAYGRHQRNESSGYRDSRRPTKDSARDKSPSRRSYRNSNPTLNDIPLRKAPTPMTNAGMPPGMSRTNVPAPRPMMSGPMESVHPSTRPMVSRTMPPGLGVSGTIPRSGPPHPSVHLPSVDSRRGVPVRDNQMSRSHSPPPRYDKHPRQMLPQRYDRGRRGDSPPRGQDALLPPENRQRNLYSGAPLPFADRPVLQRQPERRHMQQHDEEFVNYRQRFETPARLRDTAPASPRRFIPPERRPPYQRPHNAGHMDPDYMRMSSGNPPRSAVTGRWSPPPREREYQRRPVSPNRSGGPRRTSPQPQPLRRHPRNLSPPRQRRSMDVPFRRRDEFGRPQYYHQGREYHPNGARTTTEYDRHADMHHGRYGERRRDPPSSPVRVTKRQRQTPPVEQRFRRESGHHRNVIKSPHDNPPSTDSMSEMTLHHAENECAWYYVDPQGNTQGPCTIAQFRSWLRTLAEDPQFADEHKQFMSVDVWKEGVQKKLLMTELLKKNGP